MLTLSGSHYYSWLTSTHLWLTDRGLGAPLPSTHVNAYLLGLALVIYAPQQTLVPTFKFAINLWKPLTAPELRNEAVQKLFSSCNPNVGGSLFFPVQTCVFCLHFL